MSTTTSSFSSYHLQKLHRHTRTSSSDSSIQTKISITSFPRTKHGYWNTTRSRGRRANGAINAVNNGPPEEQPPIPPPPSSIRWSGIITVVMMILPLIKSKGVPLIGIKQKFDTAIATIATVAGVIHAVAAKADEMLDAAVEKLPGGLWIRKVFQIMDVGFEGAIKAADFVKGIILKVEQVIKDQVQGTNAKVDQDK